MHPTPSTSASPAPHRVSSSVRYTDGPSSSKRRKIGTHGPASNASSFSSCSVDPQLDAERRASSMRVLKVWSALESKYTRRIDEDDILDLRTHVLCKDRGVVGKGATWTIGCFADAEDVGGESAGPAGEEEDDGDEIGGWGVESELGHQFKTIRVPPARELDPADAEDLRAFLAAEECRKIEQGVEEDLSEDEPSDGEGPHGETDGSVIEVEAESALAMSEAESDDELDGYDETVGDGALLWEVGTHLDTSSESLRIENDFTTPTVTTTLARRNMTPTQLCTPPLSRSSAISPLASFPSCRPLVNLLASSHARQQSNLTTPGTTNKKGEQKETRSPERPIDALQSKWKGLKRDSSVSPTKKLLAEVLVPSLRCGSTVINQDMPVRCHFILRHSN